MVIEKYLSPFFYLYIKQTNNKDDPMQADLPRILAALFLDSPPPSQKHQPGTFTKTVIDNFSDYYEGRQQCGCLFGVVVGGSLETRGLTMPTIFGESCYQHNPGMLHALGEEMGEVEVPVVVPEPEEPEYVVVPEPQKCPAKTMLVEVQGELF